jgi:hypothetical protein
MYWVEKLTKDYYKLVKKKGIKEITEFIIGGWLCVA